MIKQLLIAAIILISVTVLSLGIRQIRFSLHRANSIHRPVVAVTEPDPIPANTQTVDSEPDSQEADTSVWEVKDEPETQHATASFLEKPTPPKAKSFKDKNAGPKDSKGLEKINLGENENLYRTEKGELWYVSKQSDGKTVKMLVHVDETTGEMIFVDAKSGGSQNTQKISLGDNENLYITEEGQTWYVTSDSKSQVEIDDNTGEVTVLEDYSDDGQKGAEKN
jgi:hypothetical protein